MGISGHSAPLAATFVREHSSLNVLARRSPREHLASPTAPKLELSRAKKGQRTSCEAGQIVAKYGMLELRALHPFASAVHPCGPSKVLRVSGYFKAAWEASGGLRGLPKLAGHIPTHTPAPSASLNEPK